MYNVNYVLNYIFFLTFILSLTASNKANANFSFSNDKCFVYYFHYSHNAEYLMQREPYYKDFSNFANYLTLRQKQKNTHDSCSMINKNVEKIFGLLPNISDQKMDKILLSILAPEYNNYKDKYFLGHKFYIAAQKHNIDEMSEYLGKGANINFVPQGMAYNALSVTFDDENSRKFLLYNKIKIEQNYNYLAKIFTDNFSSEGINLEELEFFLDKIGEKLRLNEVLSFTSNKCYKTHNNNRIYSKLNLNLDFSALSSKYSQYLKSEDSFVKKVSSQGGCPIGIQKYLPIVKRNQQTNYKSSQKFIADYEIINEKIFDLINIEQDDLTNSWYLREIINYDKRDKSKFKKLTRVANILTDNNIDSYPINYSIAKDYSIVLNPIEYNIIQNCSPLKNIYQNGCIVKLNILHRLGYKIEKIKKPIWFDDFVNPNHKIEFILE